MLLHAFNFLINIVGDTQLSWPFYGPPKHVSSQPIPDTIYLLNANLQPQPELVRF